MNGDSYIKSAPRDPTPGDEAFADFSNKMEKILDPYGILKTIAAAQSAWWRHPQESADALAGLMAQITGLHAHWLQRSFGPEDKDMVAPHEGDERFTDPAWTRLPPFDLLKEYYLLYTRWLEDAVYHSPGMEKRQRKRAAFWTRQWLNVLAPTNYFFTNPVAIQKFWESGGESLINGMNNLMRDAREGDVQMVDRAAFTVGKNLATTAGAVVFRNSLVEVIQYKPTCERVHAAPIVIITPWINKFYILDLTPRKSMVRHLVDQGFTVFITSWKNPTADMAEVTFEDYMLQGALAAIETARSICNVGQVHAVGYCIGGTALSCLMAWLNRRYPEPSAVPVAHWTLLVSLVDFASPGRIDVFVDEEGVKAVEAIMQERGYLDGKEMSRTFRLLRANSLIWNYFVHGYLYGEALPSFDVLYWNADTTRLPKAMHSWYLNECYLKTTWSKTR